MDLIKKLFPISNRATDVLGLVISIIIYLILPTLLGILSSCVSCAGISLLNWLLGVILSVIGLYCTVGIVVSILIFCKVIK